MKLARTTTAKTEIQELIASSSVALSHSEIQKSLEGLCDRVTIYRKNMIYCSKRAEYNTVFIMLENREIR
jgi:hypothetical protein